MQSTAMNIAVGAQVWVEDPELAWCEAEVCEINGKKVKARTIKGQEVYRVTFYSAQWVWHWLILMKLDIRHLPDCFLCGMWSVIGILD